MVLTVISRVNAAANIPRCGLAFRNLPLGLLPTGHQLYGFPGLQSPQNLR